ncbi:MAG: AraC family transcriptional regulator [Cyclobacteriaceae bacterium]|nr:AraC family transcriptional regulator [Cyclobacteriaceae bacterium]
MNRSVRTEINHFVKHLVTAIKPIAKAEDIVLSFTPSPQSALAIFQAKALSNDLTHILCKLIEFTPEQGNIQVSVEGIDTQTCKIVICNSGINLARNNEVTNLCQLPVIISSPSNDTTRYEIEIDLHLEQPIVAVQEERLNGPNYIPDYYAEIRKRLRSHFTKSDNLVEVLSRSNPREAAFLKRVNDTIEANIENNQFDANHLSELMNMSRTQLFRRLKPIIRQSPASYIRMIKLQKAKHLFETTDLRISEVAYQTGFETASHFTKVFTKQYGVKPSLFCRKKENVTNE